MKDKPVPGETPLSLLASILALLIGWACGSRIWGTLRQGQLTTFVSDAPITREQSPAVFWIVVALEAAPFPFAAYVIVMSSLQRI